jgi:hypothetical protein
MERRLPALNSRPCRIRIDFSSLIQLSRLEAGAGPGVAEGILNIKIGYIQSQNAHLIFLSE